MKLLIIHENALEYAALIKKELPELDIATARTKAEIPSSIGETDVILAWRVPKGTLRKATRVRWLASPGAGVDHLFVPGLPKEIIITKAPPLFGKPVAEYVIGYVLHVAMRVDEVLANKQKRSWAVPDRFHLQGRLMGILGMGAIGTEVARTARFLGMKVWGLVRTSGPRPEADRIFGSNELEKFLVRPDFLVMTLPLTDETTNMIGSRELSLIKSTSWIINVGRGRILDEDALAEALRERRLGGYVADVFATEPLPEESPLWTLPNVVITPHYAALTKPEEFVPSFVENLRRFKAGRPLMYRVDRSKGY